MKVTVTLEFDCAAAASDALHDLEVAAAHRRSPAGTLLAVGKIEHADRPDVGADVPTPPASLIGAAEVVSGFNPFAVAAPPIAAAPSTAAAVPSPIAPVATPTSVEPTSAAQPSAPATAPAAPAPTAPAAPSSPAAVELDSAGMPWDNRIHGSTKTKNADGTWRQKRGLNDLALKKRVEAELMQAMGAPAIVPAAAPAAAVASDAGVPPTPAAEAKTFATLVVELAPHISDPAFMVRVNAALAKLNLTALGQLALRPDLIAAFEQALTAAA